MSIDHEVKELIEGTQKWAIELLIDHSVALEEMGRIRPGRRIPESAIRAIQVGLIESA